MAELFTNFSDEAERSALGSMFLSSKAKEQVLASLKAEHFYMPCNAQIFEAIEGCGVADPVMVKHWLKDKGVLEQVGGEPYLVQVMESVPSPENATAYAGIVRDKYALRECAARASRLAAEIESGADLKQMFKFLNELPQGLADETTDTFTLQEVVDDLDEASVEGLPTGWAQLDSTIELGGWPIGEPSFILAPTGKGKTSMMVSTCLHALSLGRRVAYATFEMDRKKLARRMLKQISGWWRKPYLPEEAEKYQKAVEQLRDPFNEMVFYDPSTSDRIGYYVEDLERWAVAQNHQAHIDLLLVDYAQLLGSSRIYRDPVHELTCVGRVVQKLAKKINTPVVLGSQVTVENGVARSRGAREFENCAALIIEVPEDRLNLFIKKSRYGKDRVSIPARWNETLLRMEEL
jgi:replicative DNA helicase